KQYCKPLAYLAEWRFHQSGPKYVRPSLHLKSYDKLPLPRSEEHTSELQSRENIVCRLLLEKKKTNSNYSLSDNVIYNSTTTDNTEYVPYKIKSTKILYINYII